MQIPAVSMFASAFAIDQSNKARAAAGGPAGLSATPDTAATSTARAQFDDYMKMTPAERMHAAILAQLGVTEEQLKAMSPDERAAIEAKIKDQIKLQMEQSAEHTDQTGLFADLRV